MSKTTAKTTAKSATKTTTKGGRAATGKKSPKPAKAPLPEITTQTRVIEGIVLPWQRVERTGPQRLDNGIIIGEDRPPKGTVVESGEVFIDINTLYDLSEQDRWDSQFGSACLLGPWEGLALVEAGLAEEETRGGFHRTDLLMEFIKDYENRKRG